MTAQSETQREPGGRPSKCLTNGSYPWSPHLTEEETEAWTGQPTLQPGVDSEQEPKSPARGPGFAAVAPDRGRGRAGFLAAVEWDSTEISGVPCS